LIALIRIFGQRLHDEIAENRVQLGIHVHRRHGSAFENALVQRFDIFAIERLAIRHHFVKQCAEAEQIGAGVDRFSANLLRRHVMENRWNARHLRREFADARYAEPENSYRAIPTAHYFCGFKAVMKNFMRVRVIEAAANLAADVEQIPNGKPLFVRQHGGDAVALDVFHGGAELAVDLARAENWSDVGIA
jgi:hypothetical protein